jgi:cytochrome P450
LTFWSTWPPSCRAAELFEYGAALIEEKRRTPGDDVLSVVVHA